MIGHANWTLIYENYYGVLKWAIIHWETYEDALKIATQMDDVQHIVTLTQRDLSLD